MQHIDGFGVNVIHEDTAMPRSLAANQQVSQTEVGVDQAAFSYSPPNEAIAFRSIWTYAFA